MKKPNSIISAVLITTLLILPLSACGIFGSTGETTQKTILAETVFEVTLAQPLEENEILYFEMLDEVTGIALNPTRYEMEAKDNYSYFVRIPMVIGSVVKYRYVREGSTTNIIEHNSSGEIVKYRVNVIKKPAVVSDFITGWDNNEYALNSGIISGYIFDDDSDEPLSEIMVFINGQQTLSKSDGYYRINNIPLGEYDLVAIHPDGKFKSFQQGAVIADNSITPASFGLSAADLVEITFIATPPEDEVTTGELRFISNLYSLGNTFNEQEGGVSVLAANAPIMELQSNGEYAVTLKLPENFDLQYKYSLGDGFINAEHAEDGSYKVRQYFVPGKNAKVYNTIQSWYSSGSQSISFNVSVPESTPENDIVAIQFNPFIWMEPIPMSQVGSNQWAFTLYSPQEYLDNAQFRFCRNYQCGLADDALTSGETAAGYLLKLSDNAMTEVEYDISAWAGLPHNSYSFSPEAIPASNSIYIKGIEIDENFDKKSASTYDWGVVNAAVYGANMLILTPTWASPVSSSNHMNIEIGNDLLFPELDEFNTSATELGLSLGLYPQPRFETTAKDYWDLSTFSYNWWHAWFDKYEYFMFNYADYAEQSGIQTLIIGGSNISPAFPFGQTFDGKSSNTPYDFKDRWISLIDAIRARFTGQLFFALSSTDDMENSMDVLSRVDALYVEMSSPLVESNATDVAGIESNYAKIVNDEIYNLYAVTQKPVIIGIDYPSVDGSASNCLNFSNSCEAFIQSQDNAFVYVDLAEQAQIYQALIEESLKHNWIYGLVAKGYNPSVSVADNSSSIQDKPASIVVAHYFNSLTN